MLKDLPTTKICYYLAKQALDDELGEMENPAIHSFVNEAKSRHITVAQRIAHR